MFICFIIRSVIFLLMRKKKLILLKAISKIWQKEFEPYIENMSKDFLSNMYNIILLINFLPNCYILMQILIIRSK